MKETFLSIAILWTGGCRAPEIVDVEDGVIGSYVCLAADTDAAVELEIANDGSYREYFLSGTDLGSSTAWKKRELVRTGRWKRDSHTLTLTSEERIVRRLQLTRTGTRISLRQSDSPQVLTFVKESNQPSQPMPLKRHG